MATKLKEILFLQQLKGIGVAKINNSYLSVIRQHDFETLKTAVLRNEKKLTDEDIRQADYISSKILDDLLSDDTLQAVTVFDDEFPEKLRSLGGKKPPIIYARGAIEALKRPGLAVVGTRHPSLISVKAGRSMVEYAIKQSNPIIISGLANGCDEVAHTAALDAGGITVAVLPSGFDNIMPISNRPLAKRILENNGCLISEYLPQTEPINAYFVRRDSLIAALAAGTLVIECEEKSGTMHTVDAAVSVRRPVACYYPSPLPEGFSGNDKMIKNKIADKISIHADLKGFLHKIES